MWRLHGLGRFAWPPTKMVQYAEALRRWTLSSQWARKLVYTFNVGRWAHPAIFTTQPLHCLGGRPPLYRHRPTGHNASRTPRRMSLCRWRIEMYSLRLRPNSITKKSEKGKLFIIDKVTSLHFRTNNERERLYIALWIIYCGEEVTYPESGAAPEVLSHQTAEACANNRPETDQTH